MINKITHIAKVGRFSNFSDRRVELTYARNTFFIGKNTHGKSTLALIFRSLAENRPDLIQGKRTFNSGGVRQEIVIESDNGQIRFNNSAWSGNLPIKIFDSTYVIDNIYSNDFVDEEKQESIASLVLGAEGQRLERVYRQAKAACDTNTQEKTKITNKFSSKFGRGVLDFSDFRELQVDDDEVKSRISEITNQIKAFDNQRKIVQIVDQLIDKFRQLAEFDGTVINRSLQVNQRLVKEHIRQNFSSSEGALGLLSSALSKQKSDNDPLKCFFCGQEILSGSEAEALLHAYQDLFSEVYKSLALAVKDAVNYFTGLDFEKWLLEANSYLVDTGVKIEANEEVSNLVSANTALVEHLKQKQADLNIPTEINLLNTLSSLSRDFINQYLEPKKQQVSSGSVEQRAVLEKELERLNIYKERNSQEWINEVNQYQELENEFVSRLKPAVDAAFTTKNEYSATIFTEYETKINQVLSRLGADYCLADFSLPENRRARYRLFGLKFNQCDEIIPLAANDDQPNFKNTLSDSDRRLLAFAFFVVELQKMDNLADVIVVFDDPISSLDSGRQRNTVTVMKDLLVNDNGDCPNQLIVLTHQEGFYRVLNSLFDRDKNLLRINYSSESRTSSIVPCDFDEMFKDDHFKRLDLATKFVNREVDQWNWGDTRLILEHVIDRKYYLDVDPVARGNGGLIRWYKENKATDEVAGRIDSLLPSSPHHDQGQSSPSDVDLEDRRGIARDLLEIIQSI